MQELEEETDSFQASPFATSPNFLTSISFLCLYLSCDLTQILTQQGLHPTSSWQDLRSFPRGCILREAGPPRGAKDSPMLAPGSDDRQAGKAPAPGPRGGE